MADKFVHELTQLSSFADTDKLPIEDADAQTVLKYGTLGDIADYITENATNIGGTNVSDIDPVVDPTATGTPTGLTLTTSGVYFSPATSGGWTAYARLEWDANTEDNFGHYIVRYKRSSDSLYSYVTAYNSARQIDGLIPGQEYNFGVCSVNKAGFASDYCLSITETLTADAVAPNAPSNVSAAGGPGYAVIDWDANTETDLSYYNIYRNTVSDFVSSVLVGNSSTEYFIDSNDGSGYLAKATWYYFVTAVDTSGNESSASTVASATVVKVSDTHVEYLSASKILIDGVVYLSNWRHGSDATKIDGGDIYTGSVTADKITTTYLSSIQANMGSITAGSIVITTGSDKIWLNDGGDGGLNIGGGTKASAPFRVSAAGALVATSATISGTVTSGTAGAQRIYLDGSTGKLELYDSSNNLKVQIDDDSTNGYITVGDVVGGYTKNKVALYTNTIYVMNTTSTDETFYSYYTGTSPIVKTFSITAGGVLTAYSNIFSSTGYVDSAAGYYESGTEIITTTKAIQNITTITNSGLIDCGNYVDAASGFKVNGTEIINSSRVMSNVTLPNHSAALVTSGYMDCARVHSASTNKIAYFDSSTGILSASGVTNTTLGYLDISSSLTTLLAGKASTSHSHSISDITGLYANEMVTNNDSGTPSLGQRPVWSTGYWAYS
jgi:hypothetical protein